MNDNQTFALTRAEAVDGVLLRHAETVTKYNKLVEYQTNFRTILDSIRDHAPGTSNAMETAMTVEKGQLKEALWKSVDELSSAAYSYAQDNGNEQLKRIFEVNKSDIIYAKDDNAISLATHVHQELTRIVGELGDYLVEQADLDEMAQLISDFNNTRKTRAGESTTTRQAFVSLRDAFAEMKNLLDLQMDNFVNRLSRKEPAFAMAYFAARG